MRMIHLDQYDEKTMRLAKPIFDSKKRILLGVSSRIHAKYRDILKRIGINYLFIEDAKSEGITLDEMVDMPVWIDMIMIVQEAYEAVANKKALPLVKVQNAIKLMIKEVRKRNALVLIPTSTVDTSLINYAHAVNVTLLALQIGKKLEYNDVNLTKLGIGCLLHDIGKAQTKKEEEHPEVGFNILRANREINLTSAHIAYQHHEQVNGEGYPRKIKGEEILELAQICSVANDYDNFISQEEMAPHIAFEQILALSEQRYAHKVVLTFSKVAIGYPPGTNVELTIGTGIVTKVENNQRPVVRLHDTKEEIDLSTRPTVMIENILEE